MRFGRPGAVCRRISAMPGVAASWRCRRSSAARNLRKRFRRRNPSRTPRTEAARLAFQLAIIHRPRSSGSLVDRENIEAMHARPLVTGGTLRKSGLLMTCALATWCFAPALHAYFMQDDFLILALVRMVS